MRRKEGKTDMKYASNNIRNILIAGHAGSGKTTLTEALVYFSGAAERMGRVEDGTTISDFDPEEAKRKASLSASVVPVEYEGIKYNFIDAPGLFDFEAGEYEGIRAAESVLVCVSGRSGVTVGAEKAFQLARKNGKATMVFVSKCDLENANYFKILEDMKIRFGSTVCPCVVPAKLDDGTPVYINLFSQKAFKYESGKQIQVDLPDIGHRFQGLIEAMSEAIAETDDELMEKFFGGEPFTTEEIVEGMRKGVKDGLITPVFCGSAVNQQALDMLLFNMHKLLPSPEHDAAVLAEDAAGEPVELIVFAAASMTETMNQLKEMYEQNNPNVTVTYNFDSSGKLLTQIKEGADCDLFISAAPTQMNALDGSLIGDTEKNPDGLDLIVTDSRVNLLENKVTLAVPEGNPKGIESFDQLAELLKGGEVLLAMGNSDVPVGQYTLKVFNYYGIDETAVADKLTYGNNVKEVTSQVSEGAVDCGIIYATDACSAGLTVVDSATAEMCGQVIYPAAVLKGDKEDAARAFLAYLQTDAAMTVFESVGFSPAI